ncbi:MAG TPA: hypothetical protein VFY89_10135, partial [Ktedonobacterales bacterium]
LHLAYASQALSALITAAAQHDMRAYQDALATLRAELEAARVAVGQTPAGPPHDERAAALAQLSARAQAGLLAALSRVDWGARLATTDALGELGLPAVTVGSARIVEQNRGGRETWLIILTGSGFQSGAQIILDGHAVGGTAEVTPDSLHLTVSSPPDAPPHAIGIQNPDGTAAETSHVTAIIAEPGKDPTPTTTPGENNGQSGGGDKHGGHTSTPAAVPTRTASAH